ncbi:MAG TPA: nitrite/sulfite reductase, partial [Armatimonadetes bacterium]|nr:nitrite/sulfite reductase [Armatimonadota bacterium]
MHGYYRIPLIVRDDIRTLEEWVERFRRGELAAAKFRGFRVPLGIYEQRQENTYMMRVRLPGGAVTPAQLRALARLAREYGVKLHLTTRQDIQLQNVQLDQLAPLYRALYSVGLTCKGGGGNTVRNITACPDAGVCSREAFNVLPYAIALTEYLLPFPSSYNLPRKFKIAFSACSDDCALATVNDLGFIAKVRKGEPGFAVYAAGGLGAYSQVALKLHDFVPASEIGYVAEAVKRLFDQYGDRKRKHQARLRFVVRALGAEKFRELYQQELQRVKEEGPIELELPSWSEERREGVTVPLEEPRDGDYQAWKRLQVRAQKQAGFYLVRLPVPLGDIEPEMLESLADLGEVLGEGSLRITQTQDLLLRWVREEELPYLYNRLRELGLAEAGTRNLDYLVCCKGAATCKLGLCHSGGLCRAIAAELDRAGLPLSQWPEVNLRASGCPNACGQHPLASIGLHGAARRVNGRAMPFYSVLLGGKVQEGRTALARPWGHVPAKNVPALLRDFLQAYQERRETYHSFEQFVEAEGQDLMQQLIEQYKRAPAYEENPDYYRDWDTSEEFSLAGRGAGECGAGVFDMIESDLDEAKSAHALCQQTRETELLYQAVVALARSL